MTTTQLIHESGQGIASHLKTLRATLCALLALLAFSVLTASPARAAIGTTDTVPAATLLLPYFEVDLGNENGVQTAVRLSNASATAILVKATMWTDYGVPTYGFLIYFPGYASADVDLRLLFKGIVPVTASAGQDPTDQISPKGAFSQDINFASCTGILPASRLPAATVTALSNAHTGQSSTLLSGNCGGAAHGDNIARGYITFDTVNNCTPRMPGDVGYFGNGGTGDATNQNAMTGNVLYLNRAQNLTYSEPLVHIEAAPGIGVSGSTPISPLTSGTGSYTFYGRYDGFTAIDNREPLASISHGRYLNGGPFGSVTQLVVWRDPGVAVTPFACGATPAGFPLAQTEVVAFDEQEHPAKVTGNPFPLATQAVSAASLSPFNFGFFRFNLTLIGGAPAIAGRHQSYVSSRIQQPVNGVFSGALPTQQINNASNAASTNTILMP